MGNLASCAGGGSRADYEVSKTRRGRKSHRSESMPAKPPSLVEARRDLKLQQANGVEDEAKLATAAASQAASEVPADPGTGEENSGADKAPKVRRAPSVPFHRRLSAMQIRGRNMLSTPAPTLKPDAVPVVADDSNEPVDDDVFIRDLASMMEKAAQEQPHSPDKKESGQPPAKPPPKPTNRPSVASQERACRSAPSTPPPTRSSATQSGVAPKTPPPKPPRYGILRLVDSDEQQQQKKKQQQQQQQPMQPQPTESPVPMRPPSPSADDPVAEQQAGRPTTPDSLDGTSPEEPPLIIVSEEPTADSDDEVQQQSQQEAQQLQQPQPPMSQHLQKESARQSTSKSVCDLAHQTLMDGSVYENVDWDSHLTALRPTCFGSAMCHMDHMSQAASQDLLQSATAPGDADGAGAQLGQLLLPLKSRSRAACQILARPFVQCLPIGGSGGVEFVRLCRARGCLSESAARELLRGAPTTTATSAEAPDVAASGSPTSLAERFVQQFDWSETSLRKLAQCLTAAGGGSAFYGQLALIIAFMADLLALLAAKHLFLQDSRAGKRRRMDAFLRGVRLIDGDAGREEDREGRCRIQLLYLSNSDDLPSRKEPRHKISAHEVAAINEPDWLSSNFSPALSLDLDGSGVNSWFFKQLVGKSLEPLAELSLAGCELDNGQLPTLVLTQRTSRLRVLCLAGASLGDESLSALCLLPQQQLASLEVLDLSACGVTHFGLSLLAGCIPVTLPRLSQLDLSWNDLSEAAPATVAGLLDPAAGLCGLRLRGCRLASDALRAVADSLTAATAANLRQLDISDNRLNCLILTRLAERLNRATGGGRLSELGLAGVNLFANDLQTLLNSGGLDGCMRLDLGRNHLGDAGAAILAARLPPRLDCLAVASCRLGCRGLRRLLEAAKSSGCLRLVRAANNLPKRRGGRGSGALSAEEASLHREIAEATQATFGKLRFLIEPADGDAAEEPRAANGGDGRRLRRAADPVGSGGSLRRSLRRLASLD